MEQEVKTVDTYVSEVAERLGTLSEEEAKSLSGLYGKPELIVIAKLLGPEVSGVLGEAMNMLSSTMTPTQKPMGLGARK